MVTAKNTDSKMRALPIALQRVLAARAGLRLLPFLSEISWDERIEKVGEGNKGCLIILWSMFSISGMVRFHDNLNRQDFSTARSLKERLSLISEESIHKPAIIRDIIKFLILVLDLIEGESGNEKFMGLLIDTIGQGSARDSVQAARYRKEVKREFENEISKALNSPTAIKIQDPIWATAEPIYSRERKEEFFSKLNAQDSSFMVWKAWYQQKILGNDYSPIITQNIFRLSEEVISQNAKSINKRIDNIIRGSAQKPLNRVRAIFVGNGAAGKTSLVRVLHQQSVTSNELEMTKGVEIRETSASDNLPNVDIQETYNPERDLTVHYWDFGGQVMVHQTHQFFLRSNCLYVLVVDGRRNEKVNDDARHWLEHIRAYGDDAPVMIVGNKVDISPAHIDLTSLRSLFPNVLNFYPLSCTQAHGDYAAEFDRFERDFYIALSGPALTRQTLLTKSEFDVLKDVKKIAAKQFHVPRSKFTKSFVKRIGRDPNEVSEESLLDLFDRLGVVIRFHDLGEKYDILTNPEWLTRGVFEIMYDQKLIRNGGISSESKIVNILRQAKICDQFGNSLKYSSTGAKFIIRAMEKFHLLFRIKDQQENIVVPSLLSSVQPKTTFPFDQALSFRYRFDGFMPPHILAYIIVERNAEIYEHEFWQFGVRLSSDTFDAQAFVQKDDHTRCITIHVVGADANDYLSVLRDEIESAHRGLSHLSVFQEIELKQEMLLPNAGNTAAFNRHGKSEVQSWESYRQIRTALRYPSHPFIASNGLEYDLRLIHQLLPVGNNAERALQVIDSVRREAEGMIQVTGLATELSKARKALVQYEQGEKDPVAVEKSVRQSTKKIQDKIEKIDSSTGNIENLAGRISRLVELVSQLF